jgi:predicted aspartyl protease
LERFDQAIWDTGATGSVISERVVERLGLYPISRREVTTANGRRIAGVYLIGLYLLNDVVFPALPVTDGNLGNDIDVLIGMDVIGSGDFAVTHADGRTCMSFQMPSRRRIRFKGGPTFTVAVQ